MCPGEIGSHCQAGLLLGFLLLHLVLVFLHVLFRNWVHSLTSLLFCPVFPWFSQEEIRTFESLIHVEKQNCSLSSLDTQLCVIPSHSGGGGCSVSLASWFCSLEISFGGGYSVLTTFLSSTPYNWATPLQPLQKAFAEGLPERPEANACVFLCLELLTPFLRVFLHVILSKSGVLLKPFQSTPWTKESEGNTANQPF